MCRQKRSLFLPNWCDWMHYGQFAHKIQICMSNIKFLLIFIPNYTFFQFNIQMFLQSWSMWAHLKSFYKNVTLKQKHCDGYSEVTTWMMLEVKVKQNYNIVNALHCLRNQSYVMRSVYLFAKMMNFKQNIIPSLHSRAILCLVIYRAHHPILTSLIRLPPIKQWLWELVIGLCFYTMDIRAAYFGLGLS